MMWNTFWLESRPLVSTGRPCAPGHQRMRDSVSSVDGIKIRALRGARHLSLYAPVTEETFALEYILKSDSTTSVDRQMDR